MLPPGWAQKRGAPSGGSQTIPVLSQFNLSRQNFANQTGLWLARPDQDSKFKLV